MDHFCKCGHLFENHGIRDPQNPVLSCTACECKQYELDVIAPSAMSVMAQATQTESNPS